ncbi:MAG TPA: GDSL-type esterase/lipase family protein [Polyangiaceae bacterium]|nr:GDSL-type esterase/lipase family protein [Polyangiaceae bacterium]
MRTLILGSALLIVAACSSSTPSDGNKSSGGSSGTGATGTTSGGAGGTSGSAGAHTTGGSGATGGSTGSGATGGSSATGGSGATGGSSGGAGGSVSAGAGGSTGGTGASGGSSMMAGAPGAGGAGMMAGAGGSAGGSSGGSAGASGGSAGTSSGMMHWVGTWTASPYATDSSNAPPSTLANAVLRQVTHVSLGGSQIRVQFSNLAGNGAVTIKGAHVALCKATPAVDSTIDTSTDKALAFSGMAGVTINQGQEVWSDPVDFALPALGNVTITTSFGTVPSNLTSHAGSRTTSYLASGSTDLASASMSSATGTPHWFFISGIDVMADASAKAVVAIGDSITDGRGTDRDHNNRWTDVLASRLQMNMPTADVAMCNQGIGATNLAGTGTAAQARFARDVLGTSGVKYAIILDGVNDIGSGNASATSLETVYDQLCDAAHAKNVLVYGGTITPFGGNSYYSADHETQRQALNDYIRGKSGKNKLDGYIDFDAAVTDNGSPPKLQAQYAMWTANNPDGSADGLHPGPAGYEKMGETPDLTLFTK